VKVSSSGTTPVRSIFGIKNAPFARDMHSSRLQSASPANQTLQQPHHLARKCCSQNASSSGTIRADRCGILRVQDARHGETSCSSVMGPLAHANRSSCHCAWGPRAELHKRITVATGHWHNYTSPTLPCPQHSHTRPYTRAESTPVCDEAIAGPPCYGGLRHQTQRGTLAVLRVGVPHGPAIHQRGVVPVNLGRSGGFSRCKRTRGCVLWFIN
jgi:hypothetical protein